MGTEFVVYISATESYAKWKVFWTEDDQRMRQFWLEDPSEVYAISEAEYWDLAKLCKRYGVTLEGVVRR